MFSNQCKFSRTCKQKDGDDCNALCYPFVVLHGSKGDSGFYGATNVPTKYKECLVDSLPIEKDNPNVYAVIQKYVGNITHYVLEKNIGLFLFSIPDATNKFGTGTGKTTVATTIINEFVISQVRRHMRGEIDLKGNPALFIKASEFQNIYNGQFRGAYDLQQATSDTYYRFKKRMKDVDLLVIDDVAVRDSTEAFKNELFEIIDHRATYDKTTIFTSNLPIEKVAEILGDRIASRIEGMCYMLGLKGKDHRKDWRL